MMYEVRTGCWNYGMSVVCVTDDLNYAREVCLNRMKSEIGLSAEDFKKFEKAFDDFAQSRKIYRLSDGKQYRPPMYLNIRDYLYEIGETPIKVAVGGLSTLSAARAGA